MTDRASAKGLRHLDYCRQFGHLDGCLCHCHERPDDRASADGQPSYSTREIAHMQRMAVPAKIRDAAALRDTGPRPEPIATLSLYEQGRRQTLMDLGFDIDGIDTATAVEAARGLREALLRIRDEAVEEVEMRGIARDALRDTGPRPDGEGPWRDDQGYWLGGMGTPDTGPRSDRLALIHRPVTNPMYPRPICEDDGQEWPCKTAIVARLSTPRTETSETADTIRIGSKTYLAGADDD